MKVLILSRYGRLGASSRIRFYQFIPSLTEAGLDISVSALLNDAYVAQLYSRFQEPTRRELVQAPLRWTGLQNTSSVVRAYLSRIRSLFQANRYQVLWVEKELFPWFPAVAERILGRFGPKLIVDYDDAVFHRYDRHHSPTVRLLLGRKIARVMCSADAVLVGNTYLSDHATAAGARRIYFQPSVVDLARYKIRPPMNDGAFTIAWIGTPVTLPYLLDVAPALSELGRTLDRPVRLLAIGVAPFFIDGINVETHPWSEDSEVALIQRADVGVMPLRDSPWERGKCGYKLIQYMACGLPVVASPVGVNTDIVRQNQNGFLASTKDAWVSSLRVLANDIETGRRMGSEGRKRVEETYSLQATLPGLVRFFKDLG